uniref:Uncharacterized protein n=1 Tax=Oryza glumipatula TaxID=40148 RepID=A0A0D9YYM1_9ORYZ
MARYDRKQTGEGKRWLVTRELEESTGSTTRRALRDLQMYDKVEVTSMVGDDPVRSNARESEANLAMDTLTWSKMWWVETEASTKRRRSKSEVWR